MDEATFTLPVAVLRQDAVIIDEQESHIVLTLRVPIDLIRDNHALLMALSEVATGKRQSAGPLPDKPKRERSPHWTYAALILLGLALPSPFFAYSLAGYGPPVEYQSVAAQPTFKAGEKIIIVIHYRRNRVCATTFDRLVKGALDDTPVFSERAYGVSTDDTHGEWRDFHLVMRPSPPLEPGSYVYSGVTHSDCAKGGEYDIVQPAMAFSVVDH